MATSISPLHDAASRSGAGQVKRPQDRLLSDMVLPLRATFYPLGFAVEIWTNAPEVLVAAQESFGHRRLRRGDTSLRICIGVSEGGGMLCPPEPTRREHNHLYSLTANPENHAMLDLKTGTNFVWLDESAIRNRLYLRQNFLEKVVYLLLGATVVTDIHAGCVSKKKRGILLCGDSGAGKSTLAYACARAGWTYTSDDTSYLINGSKPPRVIGHSHRLRFRPETRELFSELAAFEVTPRMEGKPSIEIAACELPVVSTSPEANIYAVVYLNRGRHEQSTLVRLPEGTATERTRKELFSAGEIRVKHEDALQVLAPVPTFELRYSDLPEAMHLLENLVSANTGS